jgi:hypothetical protein
MNVKTKMEFTLNTDYPSHLLNIMISSNGRYAKFCFTKPNKLKTSLKLSGLSDIFEKQYKRKSLVIHLLP